MKTSKQIVEECNSLAQVFYSAQFHFVDDDFKFYTSTHPHEKLQWILAVIAYEIIEGTDVENALSDMEEE